MRLLASPGSLKDIQNDLLDLCPTNKSRHFVERRMFSGSPHPHSYGMFFQKLSPVSWFIMQPAWGERVVCGGEQANFAYASLKFFVPVVGMHPKKSRFDLITTSRGRWILNSFSNGNFENWSIFWGGGGTVFKTPSSPKLSKFSQNLRARPKPVRRGVELRRPLLLRGSAWRYCAPRTKKMRTSGRYLIRTSALPVTNKRVVRDRFLRAGLSTLGCTLRCKAPNQDPWDCRPPSHRGHPIRTNRSASTKKKTEHI